MHDVTDLVRADTRWGNRRGVYCITQRHCALALGAIKTSSFKFKNIEINLESLRQAESTELGFLDFVYDDQNKVIGICHSRKLSGKMGHDGICSALGISLNERTDDRVFGGRISFLNQRFISTEWSGHYGANWTSEARDNFLLTWELLTKQMLVHLEWKKLPQLKSSADESYKLLFRCFGTNSLPEAQQKPFMSREPSNQDSLAKNLGFFPMSKGEGRSAPSSGATPIAECMDVSHSEAGYF